MRKMMLIVGVYFILTLFTPLAFADEQAILNKDENINNILKKNLRVQTKEDFLTLANYFEDTIKSGQATANTYFLQGVNYYHLGKFEEALKNLKFSLVLAPNDFRAYGLLGITYKALGRQDDAREAFLKFTDLFMDEAKTEQEYRLAWLLRKIVE